jgi:hypothetical protein
MNSFNHTAIRCGTIKIKRDGRKLRIAIHGETLSRITVEIEDGDLIVQDVQHADAGRKPC